MFRRSMFTRWSFRRQLPAVARLNFPLKRLHHANSTKHVHAKINNSIINVCFRSGFERANSLHSAGGGEPKKTMVEVLGWRMRKQPCLEYFHDPLFRLACFLRLSSNKNTKYKYFRAVCFSKNGSSANQFTKSTCNSSTSQIRGNKYLAKKANLFF